jgi:hypothetical protein
MRRFRLTYARRDPLKVDPESSPMRKLRTFPYPTANGLLPKREFRAFQRQALYV